jgi:hypothetical protein
MINVIYDNNIGFLVAVKKSSSTTLQEQPVGILIVKRVSSSKKQEAGPGFC